jgi:hypothetical protein
MPQAFRRAARAYTVLGQNTLKDQVTTAVELVPSGRERSSFQARKQPAPPPRLPDSGAKIPRPRPSVAEIRAALAPHLARDLKGRNDLKA